MPLEGRRVKYSLLTNKKSRVKRQDGDSVTAESLQLRVLDFGWTFVSLTCFLISHRIPLRRDLRRAEYAVVQGFSLPKFGSGDLTGVTWRYASRRSYAVTLSTIVRSLPSRASALEGST